MDKKNPNFGRVEVEFTDSDSDSVLIIILERHDAFKLGEMLIDGTNRRNYPETKRN